MIPHRFAILAFIALSPACFSSVALTEWGFQTPDGTDARLTPSGSVLLSDESIHGHPKAVGELRDPVRRGELRWRSRNLRGAPLFTLQLYGPDRTARAWEVAIYYARPQVGIRLRQGESASVRTFIAVESRHFHPGEWMSYRLVFDTAQGRAQLYVNDGASPAGEVTGFTTPLSRIDLVAGDVLGAGHRAEFADLIIEPKEVAFNPVVELPVPPPWPSDEEAPDDWVVQDKFETFAGWWPGPAGKAGDEARAALRIALHREALGLGNEFTDALRIVPRLANRIRWTGPLAGAQASHLYRSSPEQPTSWDRPDNTRLLEPIALLARFYALDQPWNPYHRDPALGRRLRVALDYWLALQTPEGGFPEYRGIGASELPAVSFGLDAMVSIYYSLHAEPLFETVSPRWIAAMQRAVDWAARPDSQPRWQGAAFANQYLGVISAAWHLHRITNDARWMDLYHELTDWWTREAQPAGWFREHGGREDFSYSQVSEFLVDRLAVETGDPRWRESLRRAYEASQLIVGFEMDREAAVVDALGYSRTSVGALNRAGVGGGSTNPFVSAPQPTQRTVGRYNHAATETWEARAFALGALTPEEAATRTETFFKTLPDLLTARAPNSIYNPYTSWWWDGTGDYWPLPQGSQHEAVARTRPWREERFTEVIRLDLDEQEFVGLRRPGYYLTLHAGRAHGRQNKGLGILWVPGFGNVLTSANDIERAAFGWFASGRELAKSQRTQHLDWSGVNPEDASQVKLPGGQTPALRFGLEDERLEIAVALDTEDGGPLYLPLVLSEGDVWTSAEGEALSASSTEERLVTTSLRLRRSRPAVTHDLIITFSSPAVVDLTARPRPLGEKLAVRGVAVRAATRSVGDFRISISRVLR